MCRCATRVRNSRNDSRDSVATTTTTTLAVAVPVAATVVTNTTVTMTVTTTMSTTMATTTDTATTLAMTMTMTMRTPRYDMMDVDGDGGDAVDTMFQNLAADLPKLQKGLVDMLKAVGADVADLDDVCLLRFLAFTYAT